MNVKNKSKTRLVFLFCLVTEYYDYIFVPKIKKVFFIKYIKLRKKIA